MADENKIQRFYKDIKAEFKRITWPTYEQFKNTTVVVLSVCGFFALYVGIIDAIYSRIQALIFR